MCKIVVFDSGLGSLSIIKAIQKETKSDVIYFADQKNFPYGKKTKKELFKIITSTINHLKKEFNPCLVVVGSNTPSLLLRKIFQNDLTLIGVLPPLLDAQKKTKTKCIAILATSSVTKSTELTKYINEIIEDDIRIIKIDASNLINLVESGKFIYQKHYCSKILSVTLKDKLISNNVDIVTLSSTHLPFLLPMLQNIFPKIKFLDPSQILAKQIKKNKLYSPARKNSLKIFCSGDRKLFQKHLQKIGIHNKVNKIRI